MIIVIPFIAKDVERAERLCDLLYWTGGADHCLLACGPDIHLENREKIRIAAQVAFKSVELIQTKVVDGQPKIQQINDVFRQVSNHIWKSYRQSWLWLEPQCAVTRKNWFQELTSVYSAQPRRYMGAYMQGKDEKRFLARVAVYPVDAAADLNTHCQGPNPFHRVADITGRATNSNLFRVINWVPGTDLGPALIVDCDRSGELVEQIIEQTEPVPVLTANSSPVVVVKRGPGRPRRVVA